MFAVFETTLQTNTGKTAVQKHQETSDAQSVCKEVVAFHVDSTKAALDSADLLTCITSACLGSGDWSGTTHAFILHWLDQVCKHKELNPGQQISGPHEEDVA